MREIEEQARTKTKKARRNKEAHARRKKQASPAKIYTGNVTNNKNASTDPVINNETGGTDDDIWGTDIEGFEIE